MSHADADCTTGVLLELLPIMMSLCDYAYASSIQDDVLMDTEVTPVVQKSVSDQRGPEDAELKGWFEG